MCFDCIMGNKVFHTGTKPRVSGKEQFLITPVAQEVLFLLFLCLLYVVGPLVFLTVILDRNPPGFAIDDLNCQRSPEGNGCIIGAFTPCGLVEVPGNKHTG